MMDIWIIYSSISDQACAEVVEVCINLTVAKARLMQLVTEKYPDTELFTQWEGEREFLSVYRRNGDKTYDTDIYARNHSVVDAGDIDDAAAQSADEKRG